MLLAPWVAIQLIFDRASAGGISSHFIQLFSLLADLFKLFVSLSFALFRFSLDSFRSLLFSRNLTIHLVHLFFVLLNLPFSFYKPGTIDLGKRSLRDYRTRK